LDSPKQYTSIHLVYPLAGRRLNLKENHIRLYAPQVLMLQPFPKLVARIVVISKYLEPEPFLEAAIAQLVHLGITGDISIASNLSGGLARRVIRIKERVNVGFGVEISGLNPEDSLRLQQHGLGGKHRMGCGIFVPLN
jgi:CRISPR-associated protein Cas6